MAESKKIFAFKHKAYLLEKQVSVPCVVGIAAMFPIHSVWELSWGFFDLSFICNTFQLFFVPSLHICLIKYLESEVINHNLRRYVHYLKHSFHIRGYHHTAQAAKLCLNKEVLKHFGKKKTCPWHSSIKCSRFQSKTLWHKCDNTNTAHLHNCCRAPWEQNRKKCSSFFSVSPPVHFFGLGMLSKKPKRLNRLGYPFLTLLIKEKSWFLERESTNPAFPEKSLTSR